MNKLHPPTIKILEELERVSGKGFEFLADESLPLLATIQTARNGAAYHILRYKPTNDPIDYFVCYQAGFILRLFSNPPENRFDFSPTDEGLKTLRAHLTTGLKLNDDEASALPQFEQMVYRWSLLNLRSLPIGMRIDQWLHDEIPGLRDLIVNGIAMQQQANTKILAQRFGRLAVPRHLLAANAAYAIFADRLLGTSMYSVPYRVSGEIERGNKLLQIWDSVPKNPSNDRKLVDSWADALGMTDWYKWIPFKS